MVLHRFTTALKPETLHIDYLRLRCGKEFDFLAKIKAMNAETNPNRVAFISFAEWDVVLFTVSDTLYSDELIATYEDDSITGSLAGSAGYYNYVWDHDINKNWQKRLSDLALTETSSVDPRSDVLMLVSLRFTDRFRCEYGLGAELLFCNFLQALQAKLKGLGLSAFQSLGWNDMTVVLSVPPGGEKLLLQALHRIRYCTRRDLKLNRERTVVLAATYSHILGNLGRYVATTDEETTTPKFSFGALSPKVRHAHLLVRVAPSMEPAVRDAYNELASRVNRQHDGKHKNPVDDLAIELGHYNFSANIKWAFDLHEHAPVEVIQGLRDEIRVLLRDRQWSTFPETTTKIAFEEEKAGAVAPSASVPLVDDYHNHIMELIRKRVNAIKGPGTMTRYRMAVFFHSISAHLADPVRGSVVGYICRFISSTYETAIERMEPHEIEDLCQVLEYALDQATDGLSQFQHDANALGLSGRGGYARVIHAMEQWVSDFVDGLSMNLTPLVTFGMRSARTAVKYRIDVPFNTAFMPAWWPVLLHEIGHICWYDLFGWRLNSIIVSEAMIKADASTVGEQDLHRGYLSASAIAEEIFPNYLVLNAIALGDWERFDALMLESELRAVPRRSLAGTFHLRVTMNALLRLHGVARDSKHDLMKELERHVDVPSVGPLVTRLEDAAIGWWTRWIALNETTDGIENAVDKARESLKNAATAARVTPKSVDRAFGADEFGDECAGRVRAAIQVMAALAHDLRAQQAEAVDLGYASFGDVLVRIDSMKYHASAAIPEHDQPLVAAREGYVLADIPSATSLASMLAQLSVEERGDSKLNLWLLLSLWHRNITSMMLEEAPQYREALKKQDIIEEITV